MYFPWHLQSIDDATKDDIAVVKAGIKASTKYLPFILVVV